MVDPTPEGKLHSGRFFFRVEIQFWISTPVCTGLNKKKLHGESSAFFCLFVVTELQGNLTAAPAALLTPPAVVRTHGENQYHGWGGEMTDEDSLEYTL